MKNLLFAIALLLLCTTVYTQKATENNNLFIRVYNLEGDKMHKGNVLWVNDTILQLQGKKVPVDIDIRTISLIKTKRSEGNNVLLGSLIGLTVGAIIGVAASAGDHSFISDEAIYTGAGLTGAVVGTGIGGISILFKDSKSHIINGDKSKWKVFEEMINGKKN